VDIHLISLGRSGEIGSSVLQAVSVQSFTLPPPAAEFREKTKREEMAEVRIQISIMPALGAANSQRIEKA